MIRIPKKITPSFTQILTTYDKVSEPETIEGTEIIDPNKSKTEMAEFQQVLAVGAMVRTVKPGDWIAINPMRYARYKQVQQNSLRQDVQGYKQEITGFAFPTVLVGGEERLLLDEGDIHYIVNEFEYVQDQDKPVS